MQTLFDPGVGLAPRNNILPGWLLAVSITSDVNIGRLITGVIANPSERPQERTDQQTTCWPTGTPSPPTKGLDADVDVGLRRANQVASFTLFDWGGMECGMERTLSPPSTQLLIYGVRDCFLAGRVATQVRRASANGIEISNIHLPAALLLPLRREGINVRISGNGRESLQKVVPHFFSGAFKSLFINHIIYYYHHYHLTVKL